MKLQTGQMKNTDDLLNTVDLITIYKLFIRSVTEYCNVVFHSSLTQELTGKIENIKQLKNNT